MNAKRLPTNHDFTEYLIRDRADWSSEAHIYAKVTEAYDHWRENQDCEVYEINPAENTCRVLTDDFRDWLEEEEIEARSVASHERFYSRPSGY